MLIVELQDAAMYRSFGADLCIFRMTIDRSQATQAHWLLNGKSQMGAGVLTFEPNLIKLQFKDSLKTEQIAWNTTTNMYLEIYLQWFFRGSLEGGDVEAGKHPHHAPPLPSLIP